MRKPSTLLLTAVAVTGAAVVGGAPVAPEAQQKRAPTGGVLGVSASRRPPVGDPNVPPPRFGQQVLETSSARPRFAKGRILVKFKDGARPAAIQRVLDRAAAHLDARVGKIDVGVVEVAPAETEQALAALKASPHVEIAEREVIVEALALRPNDMLWESQWGLKLIEADRAWERTRGLTSTIVAVLDTGVDASHPDLAGAIAAGHDFVNGDADAADDHGHGTSVAGVVAARADNREGQAGLCWHCTVLPVKVLGAAGQGTTAMLAAGIVWATDRDARVITMSLGAPSTTQALTDAISYAASKGVVLVAAAGNSATTTPYYPAAYPQVVSVAATTADDTLYEWSNRGSWVHVGAPGCNVAPGLAGSYVTFCGTSSATPLVGGLAALALSAKPSASKDDVERAIQAGAVAVGPELRYGRVRASRTLEALGAPASDAGPVVPVAPTAKATFRGRLVGWSRTVRVVRMVGSGRLTLQLSARPRTRLTLSIRDAKRRTISRVEGGPPLRLVRRLPAGRYTFVVTSRRETRFTLVAFHPRPKGSA